LQVTNSRAACAKLHQSMLYSIVDQLEQICAAEARLKKNEKVSYFSAA